VLAGLLLAAGLTGCIGAKNDGSKVNAQSANATGTISANETNQPNGGQISAFKETNKTELSGTGAMMHAHDYWKGETRKQIWQTDIGLIPLPLMPDGKPTGTAIADFDIPYPNLVFEGTDHLEILMKDVKMCITCDPTIDPANPHYTFFFDYLTAGDEPGKFRTGGQLIDGTPFLLPVKPTDADMPHSEKSLWVFRLYSGEPQAIQFNLTVTAVKGNLVANWPPHPNLYADKTERVIFDGDVKEHSTGTAQVNIDGKDVEWVNPERVISWGTDTVDVTITGATFSAQGGAVTPDHYILEYHNATFVPKLGNGDQAGGRAEDKGTDGKTWHFPAKVDAQSYDSPYGQKSRWGFRFVPRFQGDPTNCYSDVGGSPGPAYSFVQQFIIGCQFVPWDLTYHMKVVAHGHSTAQGVDGSVDPNAGAQTAPTKG
jgi:hypothetical protein